MGAVIRAESGYREHNNRIWCRRSGRGANRSCRSWKRFLGTLITRRAIRVRSRTSEAFFFQFVPRGQRFGAEKVLAVHLGGGVASHLSREVACRQEGVSGARANTALQMI